VRLQRPAERQPIRWCAVEVEVEVLVENRFSSASDVWALGVVMWEIFSEAATPWGELENLDVVAERVKGGQILPRPAACPLN
jgi:hypothetical protein